AECPEPEVLRQREIQQAQRMRKVHASDGAKVAAPADGPRRADEVAEAIDGAHGRVVERRREEGAGEVRRVMLDVAPARAHPAFVQAERVRDRRRDPADVDGVLQSRRAGAEGRPRAQREQRLAPEMRAPVTADRAAVHPVRLHARDVETGTDCARREARTMLDPREALFFHGSYQSSTDDQRGGRVRVVGADTEHCAHGVSGTPNSARRRERKCVSVKSRLNRCAPACPIRARLSASANRRIKALNTESGSSGSTTSPVTPSSITSDAAPTAPMQALPARMASKNTSPNPSWRI